MSIQAGWDDANKTTFLWVFEGSWTWLDYNATLDHCNKLAQEVNYPIDVIVDFRASSMFPSHILSNLRGSKATQPEKLGKVVVVGGNLFVRNLLEAVNKLLRFLANRISFADSTEEARKILTRQREENQKKNEMKG